MVDSVSIVVKDEEIASRNNDPAVKKADCPSDEMLKIVPDISECFSSLGLDEGRWMNNIADRLNYLEEEVFAWDSDQSMIWDRAPEESSKYLHLVNQIRLLTQSLDRYGNKNDKHNELLTRAHSILQMTMARLEEEFLHLLVHYQEPLQPERMSFHSTQEEINEDFSSSSFGEEPIEGKIQYESSEHSEEFVIDLVDPTAVSHLRSLAEIMFLSNYEKECCQAYIIARKGAMDECLSVLQIERLSIDEILQMDWNCLSTMIKRWNRAIKVFVRVYLASEKRLCDLVFCDLSPSLKELCFLETSKVPTLQLLDFAEAIAIGPTKLEKLFRILDMYEGLEDLRSDLEIFFSEESGLSIMNEFSEVLVRLGEAVRGTIVEFKNAVRTSTSTTPYPGGRHHPLTRYVMNYLKLFPDYSHTLNKILENHEEDDFCSPLKSKPEMETMSSPVTRLLYSVTSLLESNLIARSMLYKNSSLQNFFMMNNIYYMVQKVQDSDLRTYLGDGWIKEHTKKFRQHALHYERSAWTPVLAALKDEGICSSGSNTPSKTVLKERFQSFNLAFEEVYRTQTGWSVPATPLRDDLRISISLKVLQAYRMFLGRYASYLDSVRHRERYIKYAEDDLENFLLDLFEGSQRSLHYFRRW